MGLLARRTAASYRARAQLILREASYRCLEEAAKLARKVHRHARMHRALLVEEALHTAQTEHPLVPDVRVDVEALTTVEAETDEPLRRHVVARQRQRHVERPPIEREEQLPAVRMIVRVP